MPTARRFEIDVVNETVKPEGLMCQTVRETIGYYKEWFFSAIEKLGIDKVEKVTVNISYKPGASFGKFYTCKATIKAKGKEYSKSVTASYFGRTQGCTAQS